MSCSLQKARKPLLVLSQVVGALGFIISSSAGVIPDHRLPKTVSHAHLASQLPTELKARLERVTTGFTSPQTPIAQAFAFTQDYFPLFLNTKDPATGAETVEVLRYFSLVNLNSNGGLVDGSDQSVPLQYAPKEPGKDFRPYRLKAGSPLTWIAMRTLPLIAEKGNMVATRDHLILTDRIVKENSDSLEALENKLRTNRALNGRVIKFFISELKKSGYRPRTQSEVTDLLAEFTHVSRENIIILPWLPGDSLGHSDTFVGSLVNNVVAIPKIPKEAIALIGENYAHERSFANGINEFMDQQAHLLEQRGLTVERPLMLPPKNLKPSALSPLSWDAELLSPVNWAIEGDTVFVPQYDRYFNQLPEPLRNQIRQSIASIIEKHGLKVQFANADFLIGTHAGFHCITSKVWGPSAP